MTPTELAALPAEMAEGFAYEAYLFSLLDGTPVYVAGDVQEKATEAMGLALAFDVLDVEFPDDEWQEMRLDNEPGYYESKYPFWY